MFDPGKDELGYDCVIVRRALMAASVFHLSHWRADVTVDNYILAVAKDSLLRGEER